MIETAMSRSTLILIALTASGLAGAQPAGEPERVAQLSYVEGALSYQEANEPATSALPERPLEPGDRLTTASGGRAELALGNASLRLDEDTDLTIVDLDASFLRFEMTTGAAILKLDELLEGETVAFVTPNTTISIQAPGEYRVDVPDEGTTTLTVRAGEAEVVTAEGSVVIAEGQRVRLEGTEAVASLIAPQWTDDFDNWVLDREVQLAEVAPPADESEYAPDGTLDSYGDWRDDPTYGQVWMPSYAYGGYDPFGAGYWAYNGYGYSWIDPMPWSPYTFHNGHWAYLPQYNRYGWVAAQREFRRRVERRDNAVERALTEARRQELIPDARPVGSAREAERRVDAAADDLARRLDDTRGAPQPRTAEPRQAPRSTSGSAAERNAATAAAASAARASSAARPAPAPRPPSSSSSQASRSSSISAARSSPPPSTNKSFGSLRDP